MQKTKKIRLLDWQIHLTLEQSCGHNGAALIIVLVLNTMNIVCMIPKRFFATFLENLK